MVVNAVNTIFTCRVTVKVAQEMNAKQWGTIPLQDLAGESSMQKLTVRVLSVSTSWIDMDIQNNIFKSSRMSQRIYLLIINDYLLI